MSPNVIEIGSAGSAFLKIANSSSVRHRPCKRKGDRLDTKCTVATQRLDAVHERNYIKRIAHRQKKLLPLVSKLDMAQTRKQHGPN